MTCPICGEKTKVISSHCDIDVVARKRQCMKCKYVFHTLESEDTSAKRILNDYDTARRKKYLLKKKRS